MSEKLTSQFRWRALAVLVLLLVLSDQILKIWVKLNFQLGEEMPILGLDWARLRFVENKGMAFGWLIGDEWGQTFLAIIRVFAIAFLLFAIKYFSKIRAPFSLLVFLCLLLAGAIGNTIDSVFYGFLFSVSPFHGGLAEWWPEGGGYAPLFQGRVVDMLYFPLVDTHWPDWFLWLGGRELKLFDPIFNLADIYVLTGIAGLLIVGRRYLFRGHKGDDQP